MTESDAVGLALVIACIWFGYPLHSIAADLRWIRKQIKDRQP